MRTCENLPVAALGALGVLGSLTLNELAALCVAATTILAMLPLAIVRWRALLRGEKIEK